MPRATVNAQELVHCDLKTCEGGYVKLRRLTYGQFLQRREMSAQMKFSGKQGDMQGELASANRKVTEFEFAHCVAEHNLEDDNEQILDFKQPRNVHLLDPRVGEEIGKFIDELNQFEEELGNSPNGSKAL